MKNFLRCLLVSLSIPCTCPAQNNSTDAAWTLQRCVAFAVQHNNTLKIDSLNIWLAKNATTQSKMMRLPSLSASGSYGRSFGRSIDPVTNQFVNENYNYLLPSVNCNMLLFSWMQLRSLIERNEDNSEALAADMAQHADDLSLNVATTYINALLGEKQVEIYTWQVNFTHAQLEQTKSYAAAGRLSMTNVAQLQSQLSSDSLNLVNAVNNYNATLLDLRVLMNMDFLQPFGIKQPDLADMSMPLADIQPEDIYERATAHSGFIKANDLRVSVAEKNLEATRKGAYPQFSLQYQAGSNWASNYNTATYTPAGYQEVGFTDLIEGKNYTVYSPTSQASYTRVPFRTQVDDNFRQSLSLNVNVPIFNGLQSQYAIKQAKIGLLQQQIAAYNSRQTLKQNIYKACNNVHSARQKYLASDRAHRAAHTSLDLIAEKYKLGLATTVDLMNMENNASTAAYNLICAQYEMILKMKIIDYYSGKSIVF